MICCGVICDVIEPNVYAEDIPPDTSWTRNAGTENFSNQVDDTLEEGRPLSSGVIRDLVRNSNALINYHTAYSVPFAWHQEVYLLTNSTSYQAFAALMIPAPYAPFTLPC